MKYTAKVLWNKLHDESFVDLKYHRKHQWKFDGGTVISASSSPLSVPVPMSDETAIDPEEAFIASLSSCHMLFFLSIAAKNNFTVKSYEDNAEGILNKNEQGNIALTQITLNPMAVFEGTVIPTLEQIKQYHETAHKKCYIANSVKSTIIINPV